MNKKLFLLVFLVIPLLGFSQMTSRWLNDYSAGGTYYDLSRIVKTDSYGNVYSAAQIDNGTDLDIFLIKYNSEGTQQWTQTFDNGGNDEVINMHIDAADNVYISGNTEIGGKNQLLLLKYLPDGTMRWNENTSTTSGVYVMASDMSGTNIVLTGYYASSASDLNVTTLKYDSTGTQSWVSSYDQSAAVTTDQEKGFDVCVHQLTGDIYVVGQAYVSGQVDALILKYNSSGAQQWARTRDYNSTNDIAMAVSVGGAAVNFAVYITTQSSDSPDNNMVTYKYNSNGVYQWESAYQIDVVYKAFNYFEGNAIYAYGIDNAGSVTETGSFLVKYNTSGAEQWDLQTSRSYYSCTSSFPMVNVNGYIYTSDYGEVKKINETTGVVEDSLYIASTNIYCFIPGANGVIATGSSNNGSYFYTFEICTPVSSLSAGNDTLLCQFDTINLNGSGASTYQWASITPGLTISGATTQNPEVYTSSAYGYYYAKVSGYDINGCPLTNDTVQIEVLQGLDITSNEIFYHTPIEFCSGGYVQLKVEDKFNGIAEYDWFKDGVYTGVSDTVYTATQEGNYFVQYYHAGSGCMRNSESETVSYITTQSDVDIGNDTNICANVPFEISSDILGLYQWNTGDTSQSINVSAPGSYIVTVTVPGCAGAVDTMQVLSVLQNPVVDLGPDTSFCSNQPYTIIADDNHSSFLWSDGSSLTSLAANQSGTYWCEVTNPSGCTYRDSIDLLYSHFGYLSVLPDTTICSPSTISLRPEYIMHQTDYFDFNEDISSHSYTHSSYVSTPTTTSTQCNGNYSLNVGYANGSTAWIEITVAVEPGTDQIILEPIFKFVYSGTVDIEIDGINFGSVPANATCSGDSMLFTGLSSVTADGEVVLHFADNMAGTDVSGCFRITEITVYSQFTPSSGFGWTSSSGLYSSSNFTDSYYTVGADDFIFTYTEGSCVIFDTASVEVGMVQLGADIHACVGDIVTIDAGTGFSGYNWSTGEISSSIEVVSGDDYLITATDASCGTTYDTIHVYFHQPAIPALGCDTDMCAGETLMLDAGSANDWFWSTGASTQTLSVTTDGSYSVTVTDTYGCQNSDTLTVSYHANPFIDLGSDYAACDTTILNAGSFAGYDWSNGSTSDTALITSTGSYSVTVYNAYGCSASDTIDVIVGTTPEADINWTYSVYSKYSTIDICEYETLVLYGLNPGCSYLWSTGSAGDTIHVVNSGVYGITVTDPTGYCVDYDTVNVVVHPKPVFDVITEQASCGASDGTAVVDIISAVGPYSYNWSDGSSTDSIFNLPVGSYWVILRDGFYCRDTVYFSVQNPNAPSVAFSTDSVSCFNFCDGYAVTNLTGGSSPFSFVWSNGDTSSYADTLCAGTYYLTVTDAANCVTYDTTIIEEPLELTILTYSTNESAFGSGDGSAWVDVSGGTAPYFYSWSGSIATTDSITGLTSGWYYVTVTDDNGCLVIDSVEVDFTTSLEDFNDLVQIYPNPVSDGHVFIQKPGGVEIISVMIFDAGGRLTIAQFEDECIFVDKLASGMHIMQINWSNDQRTQHKLIIE
ncbi:MAG: T9SS type A sorting domain-containing protein [Bacteroidales bacterium]|nr:T9SS type A sorting domain-containing protein [Bacteroidales bacterium]